MEEEGEVEGSLETAWLFLMSAFQMQDKGNRNGIRGMRSSVFVYILMSIIWTFVSAVSFIDWSPSVSGVSSRRFIRRSQTSYHCISFQIAAKIKTMPKRISARAAAPNLLRYASRGFFHTLSTSAYAVCRIWAFIPAWQSNLFMKVRVDVCSDSMPPPPPRLCALLFLPHVSFYQPLDK